MISIDSFPLDWIGVVMNVWGTVLNAKQKLLCFPIWMFGNIFWVMHWWPKQEYAALSLVVVYTGINIYGWANWYKLSRQRKKSG
jgi:nicotinamide riboside transporter PnuC